MLGISCLAVITHRLLLMLLFGFFHVGTLFPFQFPTLQSLPGVNTSLLSSLLLLSSMSFRLHLDFNSTQTT